MQRLIVGNCKTNCWKLVLIGLHLWEKAFTGDNVFPQIGAVAAYVNIIIPLDWNSPCRGEGTSHQEVSTQVRQREELNWASQLKLSDQQISTMSGTDLPLIRQD